MQLQHVLPKVLIVEPHPYHQEILPCFVKYFQELGYNVDCYIRRECRHSHVFCKMPHKPNIKYYDHEKLCEILSDCSRYDYVFFSSFEFMDKNFQGKITDFLGYIPNAKYGIMGCHHTLSNIKDYNSVDFVKNNKIFSCSGFKYNNKVVPMLAPIYYGGFTGAHKLKEKRKFIVVGAVTSYSKNHNLLFETAEKLINDKYKNFQITIIGKGKLKIPYKFRKYIKFKGAVPFNKMFKFIEKSDFYLPLMDLQLQDHLRYLTNCCSGSRNLVLGFNKPCLINNVFGKAYKFNETNAILYNENNLYDAMVKALQISETDYSIMHENLAMMKNKIYIESLENLKKALGE